MQPSYEFSQKLPTQRFPNASQDRVKRLHKNYLRPFLACFKTLLLEKIIVSQEVQEIYEVKCSLYPASHKNNIQHHYSVGFPGFTVVKNPHTNAGDTVFIPRSGRSSRVGQSHPLQYFCLENSTDRGTWQATVHGVARR